MKQQGHFPAENRHRSKAQCSSGGKHQEGRAHHTAQLFAIGRSIVFGNEITDCRLQPEFKVVDVSGNLQHQYPGAVLRSSHVMDEKVRQIQRKCQREQQAK